MRRAKSFAKGVFAQKLFDSVFTGKCLSDEFFSQFSEINKGFSGTANLNLSFNTRVPKEKVPQNENADKSVRLLSAGFDSLPSV